jgi:hypothetical protein
MPTNSADTIHRLAGPEVTVRVSGAGDVRALARLAITDSAEPLAGPALVAELDGAIVAAVPLDGGAPIADPFVRTAALVQMLELRAEQLGRTQAGELKRLPRRLRPTAPYAA